MLTLTVPTGSRYVATVRSITTSLLDSLDVDPDDVYDISLILGEACANVVRHAYDSRRETYTVRVELISGGVAITVTDHGRGFDARRVRAPDPLRPHGWGIWLIGQISDRAEVRPVSPHGTEVYVEKTLQFMDGSAALDAAAVERAEASGTRDARIALQDTGAG